MPSHQDQSPYITGNGYSDLPEVDTQRADDDQEKELKPEDGKKTVRREVYAPEVASTRDIERTQAAGIEVAGADGKQTASASSTDDKEVTSTPAAHSGEDARHGFVDRAAQKNTRNPRRQKRAWIIGSSALLLLLAIALGVGLGVGLGQSGRGNKSEDKGSPGASESNGSVSETPALSTKGAFNGSGISLLTEGHLVNLTSGKAVTSDDKGSNLLLVFQHYAGDIRWMQRAGSNTWQGGSESESITTWGRNATPLSVLATHYTKEAKREWHVFYVGKDNKLRQQTIDNSTFNWRPGLLDNLSIATLDSGKSGLVTCDYTGPIDDPSYNASSGDSGIRLWVATSLTTFVQISWQPGMSSWIVEQQWTGFNGHAQPACNGLSPSTVTYVMFVDQKDQVAFYWNDHGKRSEKHPMGTWKEASLNIPAVDPEPGLSHGYGSNLFARASGHGPVVGWNVTFDAENTSISGSSLSQVSGEVGTANSSLVCWSVPPDVSSDGKYEVLVLYQTEGDDITEFSGDDTSGEWTETRLPVPDD